MLHVTPRDFADDMKQAIASLSADEKGTIRDLLESVRRNDRATSFISGWAGCRGSIRSCCLPGAGSCRFTRDTFSASIMAISDDKGATWTASKPLIGFGNIQPSLVRKNDGELVAFMRDNGPHQKIRLSSIAR